MKRILILLALITVICSSLAYAQETQATYFSKSDIEQIIVRDFNGKFWVTVLLNRKIGDFEGFYYYEFANLHECAYYAWLFRKGLIKGVEHYKLGTGKHASWGLKRISVISRFYFYSD